MIKKTKISVGLIMLISSILIVSSHWNDSPTNDEVPHIGAGYSYLVKQNMRLNFEHPPLAKDIGAFPLWLLDIKEGAVFKNPYWTEPIASLSQWAIGQVLLFQPGNDPDKIIYDARFSMLLFFIFSGVLIFKLTQELYGESTAFIALIFFSFSPNIMAHSGLVTTDIPAMAGAMAAIYFFINYLQEERKKNLFRAGLFLGLALLIKFSLLLLIPFFLVLILILGILQTDKIKSLLYLSKNTFKIFGIAFVVIWAVYLFHVAGYSPDTQKKDTEIILNSFSTPLKEPILWLSDKPGLRALGHYLLGASGVSSRFGEYRDIYFLGETNTSRKYGYFPIVFSIKEPLPWLILIILSLGFYVKTIKGRDIIKNLNRKKDFYELALFLWIALYLFVSIASSINIGLRHLLPIYPAIFILVSGQISSIGRTLKRDSKYFKIFSITLFMLIGWYVVENLMIFPHYFSYFNQLAGGPSGGYRYVVDSNLDWGQDLKRLATWVDQNNINKIEIKYFGWSRPDYYLRDKYIEFKPDKYEGVEDFIKNNQSNGWLAISATEFFQLSPNKYLWLKSYEPIVKIGNSIWVWHIIENSD